MFVESVENFVEKCFKNDENIILMSKILQKMLKFLLKSFKILLK